MNSTFGIDGACRIADWGVLRARGADAAKFLQSQLSNDVAGMGAGRARLAGFCSAKGRLQASFVVWQAGADEFLLACPDSVLASTLKRLAMFVLRAKCNLGDASGEVALWGVAGPAAEGLLGEMTVWQRSDCEGLTRVRLPDAAGLRRCLVAVPEGAAFDLPSVRPLPLDMWRWLDVQSGVVAIEAATVDRFVPQMVNFELVGGIDFQKGCYPGQEVVARSQYRGTTKRRALLFDCDVVPVAGQDVFASGSAGEAAGTVANASPHPMQRGGSALIEVRLAALEDDNLRLGAADGPVLRRAAMPYPLPSDAEAAA